MSQKIVLGLIVVMLALGAYRLFLYDPGPEIRNARPAGNMIICFGDSLTYGTGAPHDMDYPSQLAKMIKRQVLNAGIPGDTTARALERLERDVLSYNPGFVLITLGGNDLKNGVAKSTAFANLRKIVEAIQDRGGLVVVGGVRFPFLDRGYGNGYENLTREAGAVLVPNVLGGIMDKPELMSDRIHPNGEGYSIMARKFADALKPYL